MRRFTVDARMRSSRPESGDGTPGLQRRSMPDAVAGHRRRKNAKNQKDAGKGRVFVTDCEPGEINDKLPEFYTES